MLLPVVSVPCAAICPAAWPADCEPFDEVAFEAAFAEFEALELFADDAWFAAWFAAWLAACELLVEVTLDAEFALLALLAEALRDALALLDALSVAPRLAEELLFAVVARWSLACCALLAAEASVVELALLALLAEFALLVVDALRLALACCAAFCAAVELLEAALLLALLSTFESLLLADSFNDPFRLEELLLLFELSMLVVASDVVFAPRR